VLTLDLGNSRLKATSWRRGAGGWSALESFAGEHASSAPFAAWLEGREFSAAALASVTTDERVRQVRELLESRGTRVIHAPDPGLDVCCREPERVGLDRLYAAKGVAVLCGRSAVIVDAGTALTVDALCMDQGRAAFLGGAIAPGPALLAASLATGTARLPRVEPRVGAAALGRVTEDAIAAGVCVGFRGAAERLVREVEREAGFADGLVVLTGGAREFLLAPEPFLDRPLIVVPELVQRGLLEALLRHLERS
jgi:type III pantothenate kinase